MSNVTNANLKLKSVIADPKLNSRSHVDETAINKLAATIKKDGLLHPPTVIPVPKQYQKNGATHLLVAGFRRYAAMNKLGMEESDFRVADGITLTDGLIINGTENFARQSMTRFETAKYLWGLNQKPHSLTSEQISARIAGEASENAYDGDNYTKLSPSSVGNYIRIYNDLHEDIKKQWEINNAKCTVKNLLAIVAVKGDKAQWDMWLEMTDTNPDPDPDPDPNPRTSKKSRPNADKLKMAIARVQESSHSPEWKEGATAALRYASGAAKSMKGVDMNKKTKKSKGKKKGANGKK